MAKIAPKTYIASLELDFRDLESSLSYSAIGLGCWGLHIMH